MPTIAEAMILATRHHQAGALREAEQIYRQILQADPQHAGAWHLLGVIAHQVGKNDLAVEYINESLRLWPVNCEAQNNLGNVLKGQGKLEEAVVCYRQALRMRPDFIEALSNLGNALQAQGQLEEAVACFRQALALNPNYPEVCTNLAFVLQDLGQLEEAVACNRRALHLKPDSPEVHNNLGFVLQEKGKLEEALACYEQALLLKPQYASARQNRALLWLLQGDFENGWPEYEWRLQTQGPQPSFTQPRWDGSALAGRTILLHAEQGLGDTIQFIRYAPLVKQRGGNVLVQCPAPLVPLLTSSSGVDGLVAGGAPLPSYEVQAPLLSLAGILGTTLATIPAEVPYLHADADLAAKWRSELAAVPGFKVGIVWQGNPTYLGDRLRSMSLAHFAPLAQVEGTNILSLQVGLGMEQLATFPVTDLGSRFNKDSLADLAAAMMSIDLVVTVDTAVAHLAGALGRRVWVALPFAPDWRWLLERETSPWYPTMRLFRQTERGDWPGVVRRMTEEIRNTGRNPV